MSLGIPKDRFPVEIGVFQYDMEKQHEILNRLSSLVDQGTIRSTLAQSFGTINAEDLKRAHPLIESGRSRGKIVLEGF